MRKCQPCEIQVRLQDQLVHHDLMTGDTFLSFSELMVLSVLAVLIAINQLLLQVSKPSAFNSIQANLFQTVVLLIYELRLRTYSSIKQILLTGKTKIMISPGFWLQMTQIYISNQFCSLILLTVKQLRMGEETKDNNPYLVMQFCFYISERCLSFKEQVKTV